MAICTEIGNKFINHLVSGGTAFNRFCDIITSTYKSYKKFIPCYEEEDQPHRKTEYKPMVYGS